MELKKKFKMPHVYVIIFSMTIITAILVNIVPAEVFYRITDADGNEIVVAGSYHAVEKIGSAYLICLNPFSLDLLTVLKSFSLLYSPILLFIS